jgi:hypothetical protein
MAFEDYVIHGRKQLLIGDAVAIIAAIAVWNSLSNPNSSYVWTGGFLVAGFCYYRGLRIYLALYRYQRSFRGPFTALLPIDIGLILLSIGLVIAGSSVLMPEYFKVSSPSVGTCWASDGETVQPVACWSDQARFRTISIVTSAELCDTEMVLPPKFEGDGYTCLALHREGAIDT